MNVFVVQDDSVEISSIDSSQYSDSTDDEEALMKSKIIALKRQLQLVKKKKKMEKGLKVSSKIHYCKFCGDSMTRPAQHLFRQHAKEDPVQFLAKCTRQTRRESIRLIVREGDFRNNEVVRTVGFGTLVVAKGGKQATASEYGPCRLCKGYFLFR